MMWDWWPDWRGYDSLFAPEQCEECAKLKAERDRAYCALRLIARALLALPDDITIGPEYDGILDIVQGLKK